MKLHCQKMSKVSNLKKNTFRIYRWRMKQKFLRKRVFVHLNCNSLLSKIEEIREFVLQSKPHIICFSESKLDSTVNDKDIAIDDYNLLRHDRTRNGGGVACFIRNSIHFNQRTDFPKNFENIFIDILLPKTTPILSGLYIAHLQTQTFLNFYQAVL